MTPRSGTPHIYHLGLGSNLNNPLRQLHTAMAHLNRIPHSHIIRCSNWYRSEPWGVTDQPAFINAAVTFETPLTAMQLLRHIKIIEYRLMGRQVTARWHSRVIDIDILLHEGHSLKRQDLQVPHPLIADRGFVIRPLLELRPKLPASLKSRLLGQANREAGSLVPVKHRMRLFA